MIIKAGCFFRILYVKGMIMTIAAGGAESDNLDRRFTKDARRVAGKWLGEELELILTRVENPRSTSKREIVL